MGSMVIADLCQRTWLEQGVHDLLAFLMLLGPIIAFICLFKKNISPFLKRLSTIALVIMIFFTGLSLRIVTGDKIGILLWILSLLSWLYVLFGKKVGKTGGPEVMHFSRKDH
jgi:hypothetical protein